MSEQKSKVEVSEVDRRMYTVSHVCYCCDGAIYADDNIIRQYFIHVECVGEMVDVEFIRMRKNKVYRDKEENSEKDSVLCALNV